ncbi:MAG: pre-peptidase C-terminal domain-containing protein [bacterium]
MAVIMPGQYDDLVACDGDDDWYAIDLMEGQRLSVEIAFRTLDGDLELALYGPDGETLIDESESLQNTERVELLRAPAPGRYFVRVYLNPGDAVNVANTYDLAVAVGNAGDCVDDGYQPNGDEARAALLPDGRHDLVLCPGDEDWFRFAIPAGNTVSFQLAAGDAGATLTLYDPDGEVVAQDGRRIVHMAETNGMYRLQITAPGDARVVYVLTVTGVSGVDLAINSIRLTAQRAAPGDDVRADIVVANLRGDAAEDVLVRYLFSLDQTASANDVVLAERTLPRVDGAAVLEVRQRLRLPPGLQADDGFVIAVLDPLREVADVRPANNIASTPLAVVAACMDDDARENEGPLTATSLEGAVNPLNGGVICPFTEDWYALPVDGDGDVTIALRFQHARGDLDLEVYGALGELLAASATEGDEEQVVVPVAGPDVLLIRVDGFLDAQNDYRLSWTLP